MFSLFLLFSLSSECLGQSAPVTEAPTSLRTRLAPRGASDWEGFLGPLGTGVSPEKGLPDFKGEVRLPLLWTKTLGEGYARRSSLEVGSSFLNA